MAETQKTYVPRSSAKRIEFSNGNAILKVGLHVETMIAFLKQHANESGYVNLGISERRSVGERGDTHCIWLDTWKPDRSRAPQQTQQRILDNGEPQQTTVPF